MSYLVAQSGLWDSIKQAGSSAWEILQQKGKAAGQAEAYKEMLAQQQAMMRPPGATPAWLVPAAIGGAGLIAFLMLRKRR
jgi:hypothetical protein